MTAGIGNPLISEEVNHDLVHGVYYTSYMGKSKKCSRRNKSLVMLPESKLAVVRSTRRCWNSSQSGLAPLRRQAPKNILRKSIENRPAQAREIPHSQQHPQWPPSQGL